MGVAGAQWFHDLEANLLAGTTSFTEQSGDYALATDSKKIYRFDGVDWIATGVDLSATLGPLVCPAGMTRIPAVGGGREGPRVRSGGDG